MTLVIPVTHALLLALLATSAVACHRAQAARLPEPPVVLEVPDPPSRVVTPVVLAEYQPPPPPPEEPPATTPATAKPAITKPADKPAAAAATPPAPEPPGPVLQTTTNPNASEQKVVGLLQAAERDLARVPYNKLPSSARDEYILAKGFVRSAADALSIKNYPLAEHLANRAAVLAAGLLVKR